MAEDELKQEAAEPAAEGAPPEEAKPPEAPAQEAAGDAAETAEPAPQEAAEDTPEAAEPAPREAAAEAAEEAAASGEPQVPQKPEASPDVPPVGSVYPFDPEAEEAAAGASSEAAESEEEAADEEEEVGLPQGPWGRVAALSGGLLATRNGLIGAAAVLLCLGLGAAALLVPRLGDDGHARRRPAVQEVVDPTLRALEPFFFMAAADGEETVYKIGIAVKFADAAAARRFDEEASLVRRDIYQFFSGAMERGALSAQKEELQGAVRDIFNARLGPGLAVKVYFREFLAV